MDNDDAVLAAVLDYGREWTKLWLCEARCRALGQAARESGEEPDPRNMRAHPLYWAVVAKETQQKATSAKLGALNELLLARFRGEVTVE
jgi:hypothetical protein